MAPFHDYNSKYSQNDDITFAAHRHNVDVITDANFG